MTKPMSSQELTKPLTPQEFAKLLKHTEGYELCVSQICKNPRDAEDFGIILCTHEDHLGYGKKIEECDGNECIVRTALER